MIYQARNKIYTHGQKRKIESYHKIHAVCPPLVTKSFSRNIVLHFQGKIGLTKGEKLKLGFTYLNLTDLHILYTIHILYKTKTK